MDNPALLLGALIVLALLGGIVYRWRHNVMLHQHAELLRLVRERTQQL